MTLLFTIMTLLYHLFFCEGPDYYFSLFLYPEKDYYFTYDTSIISLIFINIIIAIIAITAPLAKLAQGESGVPANLVRTAWVQFLPPPARSMLRAFHQAVCLPLLRFQ